MAIFDWEQRFGPGTALCCMRFRNNRRNATETFVNELTRSLENVLDGVAPVCSFELAGRHFLAGVAAPRAHRYGGGSFVDVSLYHHLPNRVGYMLQHVAMPCHATHALDNMIGASRFFCPPTVIILTKQGVIVCFVCTQTEYLVLFVDTDVTNHLLKRVEKRMVLQCRRSSCVITSASLLPPRPPAPLP